MKTSTVNLTKQFNDNKESCSHRSTERTPAMRMLGLKRSIKIALSLAYFASRSVFRGGLRLVGRQPPQRLTILYYHGVAAKYRLNFGRQMDALQRFTCVLPASYRGILPLEKKCVAITFDDAFHSVLENALPELDARSFHSTIFVPSGLIGRTPNWIMEDDEENLTEVVMTVEQLKMLNARFVAIGSHTISHPSVLGLDRTAVKKEIEDSRRQLEEVSGREIRLFSFPYGDYDCSTVEMCRIAGYESAFSILAHGVDTTSSELLRGRTKVDPWDGPLEFFLKFNGAYEWTPHTIALTKKLRTMIMPLHSRFKF
jgi:peptidoglycan/xylan/chitin deacetylase (PgdA/CDA1 family)